MADNLSVRDGAGASKTVKTTDTAGVHTPHTRVDALPGSVEANIGTSNGFLSTLAGIVTTGRAAVDLSVTVTANIATLVTHLATLAGAIAAARMAVDVDSTTTGKLDSIILALNQGTSVQGQASSTTASAVFASQACTLGVWVKNISTGTQRAFIKKAATVSLGSGYELAVGEEHFFRCTNMDQLAHISSGTSANLCFDVT
jgi:hypothetical protein